MAKTNRKIPLKEAERIGEFVCELLAPACDQVVIAGSIRRQVEMVSDVEILCRPKMIRAPGQNLLFDDGTERSALDPLLNDIYEVGKFERYSDRPADGPRYKRLLYAGVVQIDLFICCPPATWGCLLAIRTGPWDFSKHLVTRRDQCGALPEGYSQHDGCLWYQDFPCETPTEESYFDTLGLPCWPPEKRTPALITEYLANERNRQNART